MSTSSEIPVWLENELEVRPHGRLVVDASEAIGSLRAGDISYAVPMDPGTTAARLVLVLSVHPSQHYAEVALLSPVVEDAADLDLRLEPEETALPFALLA